MRAIIVDEEPIMTRFFARESEGIPDLNLIGSFNSGPEALEFAAENQIEVAFLDVEMPDMTGLELAVKLRELRSDMLIVFVSAYDYVHDSNKIGGDYYLEKPYNHEMVELMMDRLKLLAHRQKKTIYIQMFGTFNVLKDGIPVPLNGKAKEVLAYIAMFRGKEVSNQNIYSTVWEDKPYGAREMTTYFHALRRLKRTLNSSGISDLLISNVKGQMLNTELVDCDYYSWMDKNSDLHERFSGVFLPEYSWSEATLADMLNEE